jgi:hypothetical protein
MYDKARIQFKNSEARSAVMTDSKKDSEAARSNVTEVLLPDPGSDHSQAPRRLCRIIKLIIIIIITRVVISRDSISYPVRLAVAGVG